MNDFSENQYIRRLVPASGIRRVFDLADSLERSGKRILHLEIGRPDWKLPPGVEVGVTQAVKDGFVHYLPNRGLLELREAISRSIKNRLGVIFDPEAEIIVTLGASEAIAIACLAFLGTGDEAIVLLPAWPHYAPLIRIAGAIPRFVETRLEEGFLYDPYAIEKAISHRTRLIIVNSPNNPTGAVQPRECLRAIVDIAEKYDVMILSDEVYENFVYKGSHISMAEITRNRDRFVLINSFSKSFAMTGWRIGYVLANREFSDAMNRIHQYLTVCGVSFAQKGAASLLDRRDLSSYINEMREAFRLRYLVWRDALAGCPSVTLSTPGGAFYLFPRIDHKEFDDVKLCETLLEEIGVSVVPGRVFGPAYNKCIRISYGYDIESQKEAAKRLRGFLLRQA
jgi:aspartate/methionine/tyrosine aminotransferase